MYQCFLTTTDLQQIGNLTSFKRRQINKHPEFCFEYRKNKIKRFLHTVKIYKYKADSIFQHDFESTIGQLYLRVATKRDN